MLDHVSKQSSLDDREARLLRLISKAEVSLRIAATNAVIAARQAPGTLADLEVLIGQGLIEQAIQVASRAAVIRIYDGYAGVYTTAGQSRVLSSSKTHLKLLSVSTRRTSEPCGIFRKSVCVSSKSSPTSSAKQPNQRSRTESSEG